MAYTLQLNKTDTLADGDGVGGPLLSSKTSGTFTITSGNFTTFTSDYLVIEYDSPTNIEVIKCSVSGTTVTILARGQEGTSAKQHAIGCKIGYAFVPSHYDALKVSSTSSQGQGWTDPESTWAYGSATSLTVPAGALSIYEIGDKIKFNQDIPLQNYWSFDSANTDSKGSISMTNIATPTYTAGKFSNALTLNGSTQALKIGDDTKAGTPSMLLGTTGKPFTIGAWVNPTATGVIKFIFQSYSDNTNANGVRFYMGADEKLVVDVGINNAAAETAVTGATSVAGGWHYVVVSFQGNFVKIFRDGVLDGSGYLATPTYTPAPNYARIGVYEPSGANPNFWFAGQIDDLFIINGFAVDDKWVAAKYAAATAQTTADITATLYMYVTAKTDTSLTVTGGADYVPYNGVITTNYYSHQTSPVGFPSNSDTFSPIGVNRSKNTSNFQTTTTSSEVDITNLAITINAPTGIRLRITLRANYQLNDTNASYLSLRIQEGSTILGVTTVDSNTAGGREFAFTEAIVSPTAGPHTYKAVLYKSGAGTYTLVATSYILAEII